MNDGVILITLAAAVAAGTPLVLAGLGELLAERAGVLNLGVEGMMLIGAVSAFLVAHRTSSVTAGLLAGMVAAALLASVHAFVSVTLRANQIVSGLALVILGSGVATFVGRPIEGQPLGVHLGQRDVPWLADLPVIGRVLFRQDVVVYASWVLVLIAIGYLRYTKAGLWARAVGESPATADVMGVRVAAIQYVHTIIGGLLAGASGAYLIVARVPNWSQASTTSGLGWIAVALVVFSSWRPGRLLLGAYLFGAALRANFALQAAGMHGVPAEALAMLPYLLTITVMITLSAAGGRRGRHAPAALGTAYIRSER
ncbi:MAG TPA: ABC transporter permease [Methylomirabilota bacterium]|nr:ABC transporter permease [Methylomirabilota bacterium]